MSQERTSKPVQQPIVVAAGPRYRRFVTSAVALQAIIINPAQEILLLSSPSRKQGWQLVSGALEAGETLLGGTLREVSEELGPEIRVRPLGVLHVETFHYDVQVPYMLGAYTLFAYQGGAIKVGDDMAGSDYKWWALPALSHVDLQLHVTVKLWLIERAIELYGLWHNRPDVPLQPELF